LRKPLRSSIMYELMEEGEYYTTGEAARILRVTEQRVRQMLGSGELEGTRDPSTERWRIPQHAVHARLEKRGPREASRSPVEARDYQERIEELARELGRLEGRLELTEVAESTLREQLERERERADRLEEELREERGKGFWRRVFGG
jgi:excisionase family DNA binding protein